MTDDDRLEHYVFTPEQRRLELELIQAAAEWKQAREDRAMPRATELLDAVDALANYSGSLTHLQADIDQALADFRTPDVPGWVRRTWADVRAGDTVRLPGTEHIATVDGPPVRLPWHVHPKSGKYEAIPAQWSEIRVRLAGRDGVLSMDPAGEVDILLTAAELAAIEVLGGWEHRV